jgi:hypothetical protein
MVEADLAKVGIGSEDARARVVGGEVPIRV